MQMVGVTDGIDPALVREPSVAERVILDARRGDDRRCNVDDCAMLWPHTVYELDNPKEPDGWLGSIWVFDDGSKLWQPYWSIDVFVVEQNGTVLGSRVWPPDPSSVLGEIRHDG